jgi:hypothetical protein
VSAVCGAAQEREADRVVLDEGLLALATASDDRAAKRTRRMGPGRD